MKKKILYIFAFICYYIGVIQLMYWLNQKRKRIITFHNILTDEVFESNVANGVSNSLSEFKIIINEISKYFEFSLDLDDPISATITFDDGYCNQFEVAGSYLLSKNIPAYIFICGQLLPSSNVSNTEICENTRPLNVDLLLHWVSYVPNGKYDIIFNGKQKVIELKTDNRLHIWINDIWPLYLMDSITKGENLINALNKVYHIQKVFKSLPLKYLRQRLGSPTLEQIEKLTKEGWQIAWHTYSHYPLSKLSKEEKNKELTPDNCIKSKVLSYPYGSMDEVDSECLEIAERLGYEIAVSNINSETYLSGKWFRSRISLSPNRYILHLELSGLKYLIKYWKLLPKK